METRSDLDKIWTAYIVCPCPAPRMLMSLHPARGQRAARGKRGTSPTFTSPQEDEKRPPWIYCSFKTRKKTYKNNKHNPNLLIFQWANRSPVRLNSKHVGGWHRRTLVDPRKYTSHIWSRLGVHIYSEQHQHRSLGPIATPIPLGLLCQTAPTHKHQKTRRNTSNMRSSEFQVWLRKSNRSIFKKASTHYPKQ